MGELAKAEPSPSQILRCAQDDKAGRQRHGPFHSSGCARAHGNSFDHLVGVELSKRSPGCVLLPEGDRAMNPPDEFLKYAADCEAVSPSEFNRALGCLRTSR